MGNKIDKYTLLTTLYSLPKGEGNLEEFCKKIKENSFISYKDGLTKSCYDFDKDSNFDFEDIYKPSFYYMFGDFDLAVLSLIDDFKFASRNLNPLLSEPAEKNNSYSMKYKIFSGVHTYANIENDILHKSEKSFLNSDYLNENPFLSITNFKINNGFLSGNGYDLLLAIKNIIEINISEYNEKHNKNIVYILIDSFSWYEISLFMFGDDIEDLGTIIQDIREENASKIKDFHNNSLYKELGNSNNYDLSHIFANSYSYFGINKDHLNYRNNFKNASSEIEWEIKPGHYNEFLKLVNEEEILNNIFDAKESYFINGKYDYLLKDKNEFSSKIELIEFFLEKKDKLSKSIRRIRTRLKFKPSDKVKEINENTNEKNRIVNENGGDNSLNHEQSLMTFISELCFKERDFKEIKDSLLACKCGHFLRDKILNAFSNYNEGVGNTITFPYFVDLKGYLDFLKNQLKEKKEICFNALTNKKENGGMYEVNEFNNNFRSDLVYSIEEFHNSYLNRIIQGYELEDIPDLNINYKGGFHQLLISFNMFPKILENSFFKNYEDGISKYNLFLSIGGGEIQTNVNVIKANILHLLHPGIFISKIVKELSNVMMHNKDFYFYNNEDSSVEMINLRKEMENKHKKYLKDFDNLKKKLKPKFIKEYPDLEYEKYIKILFHDRLDYFQSDLINFSYLFNFDIELFVKWQWINILQTPDTYDLLGNIVEDIFVAFYFRYAFLMKYLKIEKNNLEYSEGFYDLGYMIEKHSPSINFLIDRLFKEKEFEEHYNTLIYDYIYIIFNNDLMEISNKKGINKINVITENRKKILTKTSELIQDTRTSFNFVENIPRIFVNKDDSEFQDKINDLIDFVDFSVLISNKMKSNFTNGEMIIYDVNEHITPALYLKSMCYCFLRFLIVEIGNNESSIFDLLKRDKVKGTIKPNNNKNNEKEILIDPAGGLYSNSFSAREKLFIANQVIIKSIWDLTSKFSKDFFIYHCEEGKKWKK
jgi:hypothetical protein